MKRFLIVVLLCLVGAFQGCGSSAKPLHTAVMAGDIEKVKEILKKDPGSVNDHIFSGPDRQADSPLSLAILTGNEAMAKVLIDAGAPTGAIYDDDGETHLCLAVKSGQNGIVQMLVASGALINPKGCSPLMEAYADPGIVWLLIQKGADVNYRKEIGRGNTKDTIIQTPLKTAIEQNGSVGVIKLLLDAGAKVDIQGPNDDTALHLAVYRYWKDFQLILKLLIDHGADVKAKGYEGKTALHLAARGIPMFDPVKNANYFKPVDVAVIKELIERGADVNARDNFRKRPVDYARENNHTEVVNYLESRDQK